MNLQAAAKQAAEIMICYYEKGRQPFLDACSEDVLWVGPEENQVVRTKEALRTMFETEKIPKKVCFSDLSVLPISTVSTHICEVLLTGTVEKEWSDGKTEHSRQRILLTMSEQKQGYEIAVCHIAKVSGAEPQECGTDGRKMEPHFKPAQENGSSGERIQIKSVEKELLFLSCDEILYIKTARSHTILYTVNGIYESVENLRALEVRCPAQFVRCHASYLVNTEFVSSVRRFRVTLTDGTELPIPEKKYMAVKAVLQERCGVKCSKK